MPRKRTDLTHVHVPINDTEGRKMITQAFGGVPSLAPNHADCFIVTFQRAEKFKRLIAAGFRHAPSKQKSPMFSWREGKIKYPMAYAMETARIIGAIQREERFNAKVRKQRAAA